MAEGKKSLFQLEEYAVVSPAQSRIRALREEEAGKTNQPLVKAEHHPLSAVERFWLRLRGFRGGIFFATLTAWTVFIVNLTFAIYLSAHHGVSDGNNSSASTLLYDGNCGKVKSIGLWSHLLINALSTALLGASNYCLQIVVAPSRATVDRAHSKGCDLDIGVPSLRNLRYAPISRVVIFVALLCSSLPLHFLYNSAVFSSIGAVEYDWYVVSPDYLTGSPFSEINPKSVTRTGDPGFLQQVQKSVATNSSWTRLTSSECLRLYAADYQTTSRNVIVVTEERDSNNSLWDLGFEGITSGSGKVQSGWVCGAPVTLSKWRYNTNQPASTGNRQVQKPLRCQPEDYNGNDWTFATRGDLNDSTTQWQTVKASYCLAENIEQHCRLEYSHTFLSIVCAANAIKAFAMMYMFIFFRSSPLVTMGDAIASFMHTPDPHTAGRGMSTRPVISKYNPIFAALPSGVWIADRFRWYRAVSPRRYFITMIVCVTALLAFTLFLVFALKHDQGSASISAKALWARGFGRVNGISLAAIGVSRDKQPSLASTVIVANLPQFIVSALYLALNSVITCMLMGQDWSRFSTGHQQLRTSDPVGDQRSTYWLQVPYKYGIMLLVASALLHWLISQSIFLARINVTDIDYHVHYNYISTVGYSCIAMVFLYILCVVMLIAVNTLGSRKYASGIPVIGCSSIGISAACHSRDGDVASELRRLQWGERVVRERDANASRYLAFSCFEVSLPEAGVKYD